MTATVLCVMGTRPEVIKMAPVVKALEAIGFRVPVLVTAQHRGMLDQMMASFGLHATWDLDAMRPNQTLAELTGRLIPELDAVVAECRASAVLAQGDTSTVFCAALAAFYSKIPFGHVEAGLRSGFLRSPFPEEALRRMTAVVTTWHFAPTERAKQALLHEGHLESSISVVGNTVIDSLLATATRRDLPWPDRLAPLGRDERLVLVTLHRRENFGPPIKRILQSVREFAQRHREARVVYPVHPNPNVKGPAYDTLRDLPNVALVHPTDYPEMVALMRKAYLVFTDSGGVQEEAPALGKPVLVFRDVTERPEAVEAGGVILVGSDPDKFHLETERLWNDAAVYASMARPRFPYGDGRAAERIARVLERDLQEDDLLTPKPTFVTPPPDLTPVPILLPPAKLPRNR
jgi:UDP-N-acetylglucosamine 2-epimerase (non-hydrolysing)